MRDQFRRSPTLRAAVPATMTPDKQNNGPSGKPLTPSLSAAFNRSSKTPLTPKLASSGGYLTPRRPAPADTASPISSREDASNTSYLSANVTPRSGPRNSRRDGTASPPVTTSPGAPYYMQQTTRSAPSVATGGHRTERSPGRGNVRLEPPRPLREKSNSTENPHQGTSSRPDSSCGSSAGSPMFFHADDARSSVSSFEQDTRPRSYMKTTPTVAFLYSNGPKENSQTDDPNKALPVAKRRSTGPSRPVVSTKTPPVLSPRLRSPQLADSNCRRSFDGHLLASPQIDDLADNKPQRQQASSPNSPEQRPTSVACLPTPHRRTTSVDSLHQTTPHQERQRASSSLSPAVLLAEATTATAQTPEPRPRISSNGSSFSLEPSAPIPLVQSPGKTDANGQDISDAAVNARTERKILDLEISNSSLLAINRTLERELRKQQTELRRYRRLSRSGRLSVPTSIRSTSGTGLSIVSETDDGISEQASVHTPEELSDSGDDESSFADESSTAPDEKRFSLDLSKHQELLVDSQKMNQSLKRCLGWTEELIKEGKKALEYHVTVSDVELGGRVLAPDEMSEIGESARGLLSPSTEIPPVYSEFDWEGQSETDEA
ncbi:hypothetical protein Plec18167_009259 [Paecilomyces lecythidis]|uniref:Uncharacterized protein n=1 Tax=Paecilomyces lecythidis TaxID=3004212 RepID=A0ABR3WQ81_9EURO